ncbi:PilC/PilY family type IV pilus protein [Parendozoicomonas sp. Alg238-R29]|uniref:pilus assembly protein n=1 Tax=Parendozoicomonas sp. Alg238-R29 TaxID=2993446 RepID=UPI00248DF3FE|nr:PilC/PilY family type IV pilus protein [Parendozoicomonas sp. Alg238-R29]
MRLSTLAVFSLLLVGTRTPALNLSETPLFLATGSLPNVSLMLDDSGSMDWEILSNNHYRYCSFLPAIVPTLNVSDPPIDTSSDNDDKVCFYEHENYGGAKRCYKQSGGIPASINDTWSSIRVRSGYGVRVFEHFAKGGITTDIASDRVRMPTGFDDLVSTFEVYTTNPPSPDSSCVNNEFDSGGRFYPHNGISAFYMFGSYSNYNTTDVNFFDEEYGDWRIFASALNVLYFDPAENYAPWDGYPDASFTSGRMHPHPSNGSYATTRDLTGSFYAVANNSAGFTGSKPVQGDANYSSTPNEFIDAWDNHILYQINGSSISRWSVTFTLENDSLGENVVRRSVRLSDITNASEVSAIKQNYANWYQYYRKRLFSAASSVSSLISTTPNYRYSLGYINRSSMVFNAPANNDDLDTHNTNLLDEMFSSYQGSGGTPLRAGLDRVGNYYKTTGASAPITEHCQQNFSILFTDGYWGGYFSNGAIGNSDGDPYSDTVADIAHYYYKEDLRPDLEDSVPTSPTNSAEHQHMSTFTVAFGVEGDLTDGDRDGWPDQGGVNLTESSDWGNPHNWSGGEKIDDMWHAAFNSKGLYTSAKTPAQVVEGLSSALAEVAQRMGSAASIATSSGSLRSSSSVYQARFNSGVWNGDLWALPLEADGAVSTTPSWQAGSLLDARSYNNRVILTSDKNSSNTLVGVPFRHSGSTLLSDDYIGRLSAGMTSLGINGSVDDYADALTDFIRGDTSNSGGAPQVTWTKCADEGSVCSVSGTQTVRYGVNNRWVTLLMDTSVLCANSVFGDPAPSVAKACYLGTTTNYGFRDKASKLGDIVHSDPVYVGAPSALLNDSGYQSFKNNYATRTPMVYVGANDGMLHGFHAETGQEVLGFVPHTLVSKLHHLADPNYNHKYYVNGSITVGDVCAGTPSCNWKSLLVSGLRSGGKGIFALNVTDPSLFSETQASNIFQWEFNSENDADMGFSFSRPLIVKLPTGRWGVITANGYDSTNGKAVLFILDAQTGEPIAGGGKIDTGANGSNGLSSPTAVDTDQDGDVDFVYAGDLKGNLWKFDLRSSNAANWGVAYSSSGNPLPLFTAGAGKQITTAPEVGHHPTETGFIIYFGSGQYMEVDDNQVLGEPTQGFFGIWDDNREDNNFSSSITMSDLLVQTILAEQEFYPSDTNGDGVNNSNDDGVRFRATSNNEICWSDCDSGPTHRGWVLNLELAGNNRGERQVTNSVLRNGRVVFTTLLPSGDACERGGTSWLMELSATDGSYLFEPPFDINQDAEFDSDDLNYANWTAETLVNFCPDSDCQSPSGIHNDGIVQTPAIISCGRGMECKYLSGSDGSIEKVDENPGGNSLGRQSWRELRGD